MIAYIPDTAHYNEVPIRAANARHSLMIGTADIKNLHVKAVCAPPRSGLRAADGRAALRLQRQTNRKHRPQTHG